MPGPHPDDDLLADLAADVLPIDQARAIEAHVLGCDRCAQLLSDAERVRRLLLADDPGPVPPEVWNRIESALAAESRRLPQAAGTVPAVTSAPPADTGGWEGPDPLDDPHDWDRPRGRADHPADHPADRPADRPAAAPATGGLRRLTGSRRDARTERRRRMPSPVLLATAAAVVLLAVAGSVRLLQSGGTSSGGASAALSSATARDSSGSGAARASGTARIVSSGRNYTKQDLATQVRPLISPVGTTKSSGGAAESNRPEAAPGSGTTAVVPAPSAGGTAAPRARSAAPDPRATDIRNPQRLAACLTALNASGEVLVAVDLARFEGREAAVLVLRAPGGGYEIFAVERTCGPGNEGTLDYARLPG